MAAKPPSKAARECANRFSHLLAQLPPVYPDRVAYDQALERVKSQIAGEGGTFREAWNGACVSMHGFRASSTMGLAAAVQNWRTQIILKSAAAAMAEVGSLT